MIHFRNKTDLRPVAGFPSYRVSKGGGVWSSRRKRYLKPNKGQNGYLRVDLQEVGKRRACTVHRLILETFIGPCPEGMECRHLDGNKLNNQIENLRWGTRSENTMDAVRHGTHPCLRNGEQHGNAILTEEMVRQIRSLSGTGQHTQIKLATMFGTSQTNVSHIVRRDSWRHL